MRLEDLITNEYSEKVARQRPQREDPAKVRARLDRAMARAAEAEREATRKARQPIADPDDLAEAVEKLRQQLRGR